MRALRRRAEGGAGDVTKDHSFSGKVLGRFVKGSLLGGKPFSKNSFFGRLKGDEWGILMHKHLDHHLRQFGT